GTLVAEEGPVAFPRLCHSDRAGRLGRRVARTTRGCARDRSHLGLRALPDRTDALERVRERRSGARRGERSELDFGAPGAPVLGGERRTYTVADPPRGGAAGAILVHGPARGWFRRGG